MAGLDDRHHGAQARRGAACSTTPFTTRSPGSPTAPLPRSARRWRSPRRGAATTSRFAVLFLDLDRFKTVNDSLGHAVGDQLLVAIARRLEQLMRPSDTVARLGGDEFAVLAGGVRDGADAAHVAERIQQRLVEPFVIAGQEVFVTASIGIALPDARRGERRRACCATPTSRCTAPRRPGRGRYEVFDHELHRAAVAAAEARDRAAPRRRGRRLRDALPADRRARQRSHRRLRGAHALAAIPSAAWCCRRTSSRWPRRPA